MSTASMYYPYRPQTHPKTKRLLLPWAQRLTYTYPCCHLKQVLLPYHYVHLPPPTPTASIGQADKSPFKSTKAELLVAHPAGS